MKQQYEQHDGTKPSRHYYYNYCSYYFHEMIFDSSRNSSINTKEKFHIIDLFHHFIHRICYNAQRLISSPNLRDRKTLLLTYILNCILNQLLISGSFWVALLSRIRNLPKNNFSVNPSVNLAPVSTCNGSTGLGTTGTKVSATHHRQTASSGVAGDDGDSRFDALTFSDAVVSLSFDTDFSSPADDPSPSAVCSGSAAGLTNTHTDTNEHR